MYYACNKVLNKNWKDEDGEINLDRRRNVKIALGVKYLIDENSSNSEFETKVANIKKVYNF